MNIKIIIPSYNPTQKLIKLVDDLIKNSFDNILIVDDGSLEENKKIYKKLPKVVDIIYHANNKGKGAALKTGIETIDKEDAFITVDADGQHKVEDVIKIKKELKKSDIVIGKRNFKNKNVPFKSKLGNRFSCFAFKIITGKYCPDTQSGLRGINSKYKSLCTRIPGNRFEYEMNLLIDLANKNNKITYIDIETIYENNNKNTNFRAIKDSLLIYKNQLHLIGKWIFKFLVSFILFFLSYKLFKSFKISKINRIFLANVISYIPYLNKKTFETPSLCMSIYIIQMVLSFLIVYKFRNSINIFALKIIVDFVLSLVFKIFKISKVENKI